MSGEAGAVRAAALLLLARRDHSVAELRRRLCARGFDAAAVESVLAALVAEGWLSEQRLAEAIIRRGLARGHGPRRLEAALTGRGLDPDRARQCVAALVGEGVDWLERARAAVRGMRPRAGEGEQRFRARLARCLERRGFPVAVIARVLDLATPPFGEE